ncbi:transporter substrate-binding domain-containing protein [Pseudodesulfovibrio sp. zrk46]|uniref:substrate-binding periplasmic protein n=1 Tax=Pseudodesulfovibrio sp. zrk46 TaxID=2725288 RepID=UPI001449767D|nr:transporter substrate-binding domain-containing protein [Pseudodesulfovibrio sp. zrk46]QJB56709.1 transporter substrate-binding domain-containing protein [Pseudodesulfovibrio sp. zrk46]
MIIAAGVWKYGKSGERSTQWCDAEKNVQLLDAFHFFVHINRMLGEYITRFLSLVLLVLMMGGAAIAEEVKVGIGFSIPPYVIKNNNSGLEVEIIRSSLAAAGHAVQFIYLPNLRLPVEFAQNNVDCVAANASYDLANDSGRPVSRSDETLSLQNYAITLSRNGLVINSLQDLGDKQVLAFNNAVKYLSPTFAAIAGANPHYSELADQSLQVRMLYSGRTQVVVADKRIFLWWRQQILNSNLADDVDMLVPLKFHAIFPPSPRRVHFGSKRLCSEFNNGLATIKKNGLYDRIMERYVKTDI